MHSNGEGIRPCMACGEWAARWLVTWPYGEKSGPGRPLAYCDHCREEKHDALWLAMPWSLLQINPEVVLVELYRAGLVGPDPEVVASELDLPGPWVVAARKLMESQNSP